jgi:hypothetical protein
VPNFSSQPGVPMSTFSRLREKPPRSS